MPRLLAAFQYGYVMGLAECKNTRMAFITCALIELTLITFFRLMWSGPQKYLNIFVQIKCMIISALDTIHQTKWNLKRERIKLTFLTLNHISIVLQISLCEKFSLESVYYKCQLVWYSDICNDIHKVWLNCTNFGVTVYILVCSCKLIIMTQIHDQ